jgi:hypothetical protein
VLQLRSILRDEITNIIKSVFKDEIENYIKDSLHTVTNKIEVLKLDNTKLKADIDALEQYGRRELIRFSGIVETPGENESGSFRPDDLFAPGRFAPGRFAPESESIRPT